MPQVDWNRDARLQVRVSHASDEQVKIWHQADAEAVASATAVATGAPAPNTPLKTVADSVPTPADPAPKTTPNAATQDNVTCSSEDAAAWNSFVHWARTRRGPQWDTGTGTCVATNRWQVPREGPLYYGYEDDADQLYAIGLHPVGTKK